MTSINICSECPYFDYDDILNEFWCDFINKPYLPLKCPIDELENGIKDDYPILNKKEVKAN